MQLIIHDALVNGSPPGASPAACPVLLQSGTGQANPAAIPPPLAIQGLECHLTATA